ncbi:CopD family protein [Sideroxydans sp. CL21]|uniref:CopD family protein n=1 Tax=Sideroxydans sp. CL21 TaxID=2600596 RepID=UPI0024BD0670|nr:CopD family protein [Sideroxydans sp. CL21]
MTFFRLLHLLAVLIWVGGMFFAYVVLRPAAVDVLQPPERLRLWDNVFHRFFNWVWGAIGAILASGLYMIYLYGGMAHVPRYIHIMLLLGLVMMGIYVYVFFACYVQFKLNVAKERWKEAGAILGKIRKLIGVNVTLGLVTVCVAVIGKLWG